MSVQYAVSNVRKPFLIDAFPIEGSGDGGDTAHIRMSAGADAVTSIRINGVTTTIISRTTSRVFFTIPPNNAGIYDIIVNIGDRRIYGSGFGIQNPVRYTYLSNPTGGGWNDVTTFASSSKTANSITLTWTDVTAPDSNPADSYFIRRSTSTQFRDDPETFWHTYSEQKIIGVGTQSVTFTGLAPSTSYYFAIVPFDDSGSGNFGNIVPTPAISVTTDAGQTAPTITEITVNAYDDFNFNSSVFVGQNTHLHSDWEIAAGVDPTFSAPVASSYDDTTNKTTWPKVVDLTNDGDFLVRVRHHDSVTGDGPWSAGAEFTNSPPPVSEGDWPNDQGLTHRSEFNLTGVTFGEPPNFQNIPGMTDPWFYIRRDSYGEVINDSSAPSGRGKLFRYVFPASKINEAGDFDEAASLRSNQNLSSRDIYFGAVLRFSSNWVNHTIGEKILHLLMGEGCGTHFVGKEGQSTPNIVAQDLVNENYRGDYTFIYGTFYRFEWLEEPPVSLPGNGRLRLWITPWTGSAWGAVTLVVDVTHPFSTCDAIYDVFELSGVFGGLNDPNISTDQYIDWDTAVLKY